MARLLSWSLVVCCLVPCYSLPYRVEYFKQQIYHFNFLGYLSSPDQRSTFDQRYLIQDKWWSKEHAGPIFFYTGNEGDITEFYDACGFVMEAAEACQALVVFAEHRFYGDSLPFGNRSFEKPFIGALTSEEAIADYAVLITYLKKSLNASLSPVIVFGGSYGGMLSAYMRFKYPNLVDGAIAASAPIYLVGNVGSHDFFFEDVTRDFLSVSPLCVSKVKQAFVAMDYLKQKGKQGLRKLSSSLRLCNVVSTDDQYRHLLGWVRNAFVYLAMFDYPYPTTFFEDSYPVKAACKKVMNSPNVIEGILEAISMYYNGSTLVHKTCNDIYQDYVECADPTGCGVGANSKAWDYQACTEITLPDSSNNVTDMFPKLSFTFEEKSKYCFMTWGVIQRPNWFGIQMWGKDILGSSNIVFSNGALDPWRRGGVNRTLSESLISILIKDGAHHLDLRASHLMDPPSVKIARKVELDFIRKWITDVERKRLLHA